MAGVRNAKYLGYVKLKVVGAFVILGVLIVLKILRVLP